MQLPLLQDTSCTLCELGPHASAQGWSVCQPTIWDSLSQPPSEHTPLLFVLGERPSMDEARTGRPFTGMAGMYLRSQAGWSLFSSFKVRQRACVYLANVVRCPCVVDVVPASSLNVCSNTYLLPHLEPLGSLPCSNRIALLMGAPAVKHWYALSGQRNVSLAQARNQQGSETVIRGTPWVAVSTYNPGIALRESSRHLEISDHFTIIDRLLRGEPVADMHPDIVEPGAPPA
jgi:uracil-DNA glycosylase family 4